MSIQLIQTHPGSSHKDDFLACCVLIHTHRAPVLRAEPDPGALDDPTICVVDTGHRHDPRQNNFDHHQLPADHEPCCALSLVLQDLGLYQDALAFCDWMETAEWLDARGPNRTADWLGVSRSVLARLNSPIDMTLLRRFAQCEMIEVTHPLWEVMRWIGADLVNYLHEIRSRLDFIKAHAEFWPIESDTPLRAVFLPRTDPPAADPSGGLGRFVAGLSDDVPTVAMIYPDRRGQGYALTRVNDDPRFDFNRIADQPDVHFAHASGFLAKTAATDLKRLLQLLELAMHPQTSDRDR